MFYLDLPDKCDKSGSRFLSQIPSTENSNRKSPIFYIKIKSLLFQFPVLISEAELYSYKRSEEGGREKKIEITGNMKNFFCTKCSINPDETSIEPNSLFKYIQRLTDRPTGFHNSTL